jgi:hypothetical protein
LIGCIEKATRPRREIPRINPWWVGEGFRRRPEASPPLDGYREWVSG